MDLSLLEATIRTDRPVRGAPALLRGFFAQRQPESVLLHQHQGDGEAHRFLYLYPRVQYRIRDGTPAIIGVAEGTAAVASAVQGIEALELAGWTYRVTGVDFREQSFSLEALPGPIDYAFASPWLALNQKNHREYVGASARDKQRLLNRVAIGNILSMCKSLGYVVNERLEAHVDVRPQTIYVKNQEMIGFIGSFSVNFALPAGLGLGHLASIGYGEVRCLSAS